MPVCTRFQYIEIIDGGSVFPVVYWGLWRSSSCPGDRATQALGATLSARLTEMMAYVSQPPMSVWRSKFSISTSGRGTYDLTEKVKDAVRKARVAEGLCSVFVHHTSASLILCENADPDVRADLERFASRFAPDGDAIFSHVDEGPDDMPAHIRSVFTASSLSIPIENGACDLGTWQGVYLWEHRLAPHNRQITVSVLS